MAEIRTVSSRLYARTKFSRLTRWQAANLHYVVAEPGIAELSELPEGWGLLVREGETLQRGGSSHLAPRDRVAALEFAHADRRKRDARGAAGVRGRARASKTCPKRNKQAVALSFPPAREGSPMSNVPNQQQVNLQIRYDETNAKYANQVLLNTTAEEVYLDFSPGIVQAGQGRRCSRSTPASS